MAIEIGRVEALFRYPIKSMAGESLEAAALGWHGVEGDRRLAFRRLDGRGGFPWLTGGRLPELTSFTPVRKGHVDRPLPSHVRTPEGEEMPLYSEELAADVSRRHGHPVRMMNLKHGIFDEGTVSVIAASTIAELARLTETETDVRRFRPNILVQTTDDRPFEEDEWVGGTLRFGVGDDAATVAVTMRDLRCSMINIDPEGGPSNPALMKACVRVNDNHAGVYATVTRAGRLAVGQTITLHR
ncbi:MAG: MOSC N-terminal beta barrel domain-containing protein [Myxococcota bacterium]